MKILEENKHGIDPKKLKKDHKIIETLVKKFNVHIHTQNLLREDPQYLRELNNEINQRLEYMRSPHVRPLSRLTHRAASAVNLKSVAPSRGLVA